MTFCAFYISILAFSIMVQVTRLVNFVARWITTVGINGITTYGMLRPDVSTAVLSHLL